MYCIVSHIVCEPESVSYCLPDCLYQSPYLYLSWKFECSFSAILLFVKNVNVFNVGRLGLVDYDIVEESNLHRQLLHNEDQLGKPKVASAVVALKK